MEKEAVIEAARAVLEQQADLRERGADTYGSPREESAAAKLRGRMPEKIACDYALAVALHNGPEEAFELLHSIDISAVEDPIVLAEIFANLTTVLMLSRGRDAAIDLAMDELEFSVRAAARLAAVTTARSLRESLSAVNQAVAEASREKPSKQRGVNKQISRTMDVCKKPWKRLLAELNQSMQNLDIADIAVRAPLHQRYSRRKGSSDQEFFFSLVSDEPLSKEALNHLLTVRMGGSPDGKVLRSLLPALQKAGYLSKIIEILTFLNRESMLSSGMADLYTQITRQAIDDAPLERESLAQVEQMLAVLHRALDSANRQYLYGKLLAKGSTITAPQEDSPDDATPNELDETQIPKNLPELREFIQEQVRQGDDCDFDIVQQAFDKLMRLTKGSWVNDLELLENALLAAMRENPPQARRLLGEYRVVITQHSPKFLEKVTIWRSCGHIE